TFCGLLLFWRNSPLSRLTAIPLVAAASCFALIDVTLAVTADPAFGHESPLDLMRLAGWGCLAFAGISQSRAAAIPVQPTEPTRFASRLRQAVVPASVFFICIAWLDAALNPLGRVEVNLGLAFMGALVAVRVGQ